MTKDPVEARLNRIEGQIKAVSRMYKQGSSCVEVVQQIQAARSALGKVAVKLLVDEVKKCASQGSDEELDNLVEKTLKMV